MTPVSFVNMPSLTSRRYFEPIARASMTFRFLDPPDTFRLSATVLPTVSFYHLPMGPMKDDTSLMMNNVTRYPLPVLPSNPCVGFRLVLRIIIEVRLFYVQPSTFLLGIPMASLVALVDLMTRNSVDLLAYVSSTENMSHAKSDRLSSPSTLLSMLSVMIF
jgi:hypothetical protein